MRKDHRPFARLGVDPPGGSRDGIVSSDVSVPTAGGEDPPRIDGATSFAVQSLRGSSLLVTTLAFIQVALAFSATCVLSSKPVRTGWAQTYGAIMSLVCGLEGTTHLVARATRRLSLALEGLSLVVSAMTYAGVAGLITNTEDDQHGTAIDEIEAAACLLSLAWGLMVGRMAACSVERDAKKQCTYEFRF